MSNSGASTPRINFETGAAAAQTVVASPIGPRRGAINLGQRELNPNGTIVQPNIAAAARQANANAARQTNGSASAAASTNSMNNQGGKRKTHRKMKKTRRNKNKRKTRHH